MEAPRRMKWSDKFFGFVSSDGTPVFISRSAKTHETLFSKMEDADIFVRANFADAAWVALKSGASEISIKEAVEFAAAFSNHWTQDAGVFCIKKNQLSKTIPTGELLAKGYFFVAEPRIWFKETEQKLCIGVSVDEKNKTAKLVAGPVLATRKNSNYFVTLTPGAEKNVDELCADIKNRIMLKAAPEHKPAIDAISVEEIKPWIPSGKSDLVG